MFKQLNIPVLGLVENMAYFVCSKCDTMHEIFSRGGARVTAEKMDIPFLGELPLMPVIREGGDTGIPFATQPDHPATPAIDAMAARLFKALEERQDVKGPAIRIH